MASLKQAWVAEVRICTVTAGYTEQVIGGRPSFLVPLLRLLKLITALLNMALDCLVPSRWQRYFPFHAYSLRSRLSDLLIAALPVLARIALGTRELTYKF